MKRILGILLAVFLVHFGHTAELDMREFFPIGKITTWVFDYEEWRHEVDVETGGYIHTLIGTGTEKIELIKEDGPWLELLDEIGIYLSHIQIDESRLYVKSPAGRREILVDLTDDDGYTFNGAPVRVEKNVAIEGYSDCIVVHISRCMCHRDRIVFARGVGPVKMEIRQEGHLSRYTDRTYVLKKTVTDPLSLKQATWGKVKNIFK